MFSEIVSYSQGRSDKVEDLEGRLSSLGYEVGMRVLSLLMLRNTQAAGGKVSAWRLSHVSTSQWGEDRLTNKDPKREHRLIPVLQFIHTQVYKYCFGRPADGLEKAVESEDEC